jgi:hypothetical protein
MARPRVRKKVRFLEGGMEKEAVLIRLDELLSLFQCGGDHCGHASVSDEVSYFCRTGSQKWVRILM